MNTASSNDTGTTFRTTHLHASVFNEWLQVTLDTARPAYDTLIKFIDGSDSLTLATTNQQQIETTSTTPAMIRKKAFKSSDDPFQKEKYLRSQLDACTKPKDRIWIYQQLTQEVQKVVDNKIHRKKVITILNTTNRSFSPGIFVDSQQNRMHFYTKYLPPSQINDINDKIEHEEGIIVTNLKQKDTYILMNSKHPNTLSKNYKVALKDQILNVNFIHQCIKKKTLLPIEKFKMKHIKI